MSRLFKNKKLVRSPKYCRFCANHHIKVLEKGHRSKCGFRFCKCEECSKNAKKVQTSKDHRKKKEPQANQSSSPSQNNSISNESESTETIADDTEMTLKSFVETYFEGLSSDVLGNFIQTLFLLID